MKLSLTIEGSPAVIAAVLAALPNVHGADPAPVVSVAIPSLTGAAAADDDDNGPVDATAPELDASGLPWDARIHAASKARVSNGTWRRKRNVSDVEAAPVEAELRAKLTAPIPTGIALGAPAVIPAPVDPVAMPVPVMQPVPTMQPVPVMPQPAPMPVMQPVPIPQPEPVPQPVAQPQPVVQSGEIDMTMFMQHIGTKMNERDANGAPLIHADYLGGVVNEINTAFNGQPNFTGISVITDIASNPALINYAVQILQRDGRW